SKARKASAALVFAAVTVAAAGHVIFKSTRVAVFAGVVPGSFRRNETVSLERTRKGGFALVPSHLTEPSRVDAHCPSLEKKIGLRVMVPVTGLPGIVILN